VTARAQTASEVVLHSFAPSKGLNPNAGVISDSAGNLSGTTLIGGTAIAGVVFKVDTAGHETVLYSFTGGPDGGYPYAGAIRDSAGNFCGTTYHGGTANMGEVYQAELTYALILKQVLCFEYHKTHRDRRTRQESTKHTQMF
jgi:uncharacterized repeat protein (TIGR03803 family)